MSTAYFPVHAKTLAGGFSQRTFFFVLLLFVGGAITRSAIATRLDDFTIDEAYHIAAGASYVRRADFRLNPEHPPLVKLWVGALMSATGFHLSPFRQFHDKATSAILRKKMSFSTTILTPFNVAPVWRCGH